MTDATNAETTRQVILTQARELFLSAGYHNTSMRQIAQAAGISTGPLYFHFQNKAEIFFYICCQAYDRLLDDFRRAAAGETRAGLRLRSIFYAYWNFFHAEPQLFEILHLSTNPLAGIDLPPVLRQALNAKNAESIDIMEGIIASGIAARELKPFEPRALALFLYATAEGVFQAKQSGALQHCDRSLDAVIETAVGVIGTGMVNLEG
jgi:AcrR family transcriptional regulator